MDERLSQLRRRAAAGGREERARLAAAERRLSPPEPVPLGDGAAIVGLRREEHAGRRRRRWRSGPREAVQLVVWRLTVRGKGAGGVLVDVELRFTGRQVFSRSTVRARALEAGVLLPFASGRRAAEAWREVLLEAWDRFCPETQPQGAR